MRHTYPCNVIKLNGDDRLYLGLGSVGVVIPCITAYVDDNSLLAFGDGSVRAFKAAVSLVNEGGLLVFNLKEDVFVSLDLVNGFEGAATDGNGFSGLIHNAIDKGYFSIVAKRRYCHRYSVTGEPLYHVAVVAVKNATLC